jgi:hypothetical protein
MPENSNHTPMHATEATGNAPMAAADACEHFYSTHILGGHPLHVRACVFCRTPDWNDLREQADQLYQWGWNEATDGKPMRNQLTAYDMPRQDEVQR